MPLGAVGEPGRLLGLYQWHRLEEFRVESPEVSLGEGCVEELNLNHALKIG